MRYFSTNRSTPDVSFREAVLQGQAADRGLFFPSEIPRLSPAVSTLAGLSQGEIAYEAIRPYVDGEIPDDVLFEICTETVNFDFPLIEVTSGIFALELFHGPTLAFKDVGARFMSRCLGYFADERRRTVVIVATSGDTGGAVAAGFHEVENIEVVILYPSGKVSRVQELQLATLGGNVTTLEVQGTFDDCQALAKQALADRDLQRKVDLTSANSINVARWLPQQFYYLFALEQWAGEPPVISVPSGNFGNLASGMLAWASGLSVGRFVAACNANDVVPRYFRSGEYEPRPSVSTLSNAMDVGEPSNFVRVLEIAAAAGVTLGSIADAVSINDEETAETMRRVYEETGYILDPHGAVGYRALERHGEVGIFLETAHPVKFDCVNEIIGIEPEIPEQLGDLMQLEKASIEIGPTYEDVRDVILSKV